MENFLLHCCSLILVAILLTFTTLRLVKPKSCSLNLPPSPPSLPLIGHLHLISLPFHHYLSRLSERYGPIVSLRFGSFPVLVVSSPLALKECFSENDIIFANRPIFPSGRHLSYDYTVLPSAPYGPLWRNLRRISTIEIFSSSPINSLTPVRQEENRAITKELFKRCGDGGAFTEVDMTSMFEKLTLNVTMKILAGKRYFWSVSTEVSEEGQRFQNLVREILYLSSTNSPENFLPFLKWIGFTGLKWRGRQICSSKS